MTDTRPELHPATRAQIEAASPGASAWVSANAGSGKTSVLTKRVARLLLADCPPERILCLTYTRAAAAEMQERLFRMLGEWSLMEDAALAAELAALGGDPPEGGDDLARARKLFAKALETPGGLKIQTIHAFCAALLRRFPLESGAPAGFVELDDRTRARILDELRDDMAGAAEAGADSAFDAAADRLTETGLTSLSESVFHRRGWFPGADRVAPVLHAAYDVPEGWDFLDHAGGRLMDEGPDGLRDLAAALTTGGATDRKLADLLAGAASALDAGDIPAAIRAVEAAGLTQKGEPRSLRTLPTKAVRAAWPWAAEAVEGLVEMAVELRQGRIAQEGLAKSLDLHRFGDALLARYAAEKTRRGAIDFDDLVRIAGRLLTEAEMAAFALWKLDGGLDHILIDEAQDTSPDQWRLVRALAEEFFAGAGAREAGRTVFAVGDEKQSIYSFQGAEPREFGRMRDLFRDRLAAMEAAGEGPALRETQLAWSFRSSPVILGLVDQVFADAPEGLSADGDAPSHSAFHAAMPGRVELWPLLTPPEKGEEPPWHAPVDARPPLAPTARLAAALAEQVDRMLREGGAVPDRDAPSGWRAMRPGDVIVLLRRRGALATMLVDQLKRRAVPVAGADRLMLMSSLAVRDLLSLLRAALDSGDDLSVAEVLRSPLGGVDEAGLFDLAAGRGPHDSLWNRLKDRREDWPQAAALLEEAIDGADFARPYEILQNALVRHGARARIRARLNPEEEDAVDELLAQALAYEKAETPTLAGFLAWMEAAGDLALKREMGRAGDAVRVMTVHGAKGLEAPVVILGDAGPRQGHRGGDVLQLPPVDPGDPEVAIWSAPRADEAAPVTEAKEIAAAREAEEDLRLLYVALTRAGARLLVCGVETGRGDAEASWHGRVASAMEALGARPGPVPAALAGEADLPPVMVLETAWPETPPADASPPAAPPAASEPAEAPDVSPALGLAPLAEGPLAPSAARRKRLAASALMGTDGDHAPPFAPGAAPLGDGPAAVEEGEPIAGPLDRPLARPLARDVARARGDAVHMLLELLPDLPDQPGGDRAGRGAALVAAAHPDMDAGVRADAVAEALRTLDHPDAAPFLAPDALAEATLSADLPGGARMIGRLDRLIVAPGRLRLLDWKTGPVPPATPEAYLRQMAGYRAALAAVYPEAEIEAALFWTSAQRLEVLDPAALDAAFGRAVAALKTG